MIFEVGDTEGDTVIAFSIHDAPTAATEALELTSGDRQNSYGHPLDDFGCTAVLWSAWLAHKYGLDVSLEAEDVGWLMTLLKISREGNASKRDNLVDAHGYLNCVEEIGIERVRRARSADSESASLGEPVTRAARIYNRH